MDSNTHQSYQLKQQNQPNSGLLRFRSAPSSLFSNLTPSSSSSSVVDDNNNNNNNNKGSKHFWDVSESERLVSRFVNNDNISGASCSKEMNSGYGGGGLPPHYPRHGSAASTSSSAMDGSFGLVGSLGMDHETTSHKSFGLNLLRQASSPAGLFSNISFDNGNFVLALCFYFSLVNFCFFFVARCSFWKF
jgi:hypothetical protein